MSASKSTYHTQAPDRNVPRSPDSKYGCVPFHRFRAVSFDLRRFPGRFRTTTATILQRPSHVQPRLLGKTRHACTGFCALVVSLFPTLHRNWKDFLNRVEAFQESRLQSLQSANEYKERQVRFGSECRRSGISCARSEEFPTTHGVVAYTARPTPRQKTYLPTVDHSVLFRASYYQSTVSSKVDGLVRGSSSCPTDAYRLP